MESDGGPWLSLIRSSACTPYMRGSPLLYLYDLRVASCVYILRVGSVLPEASPPASACLDTRYVHRKEQYISTSSHTSSSRRLSPQSPDTSGCRGETMADGADRGPWRCSVLGACGAGARSGPFHASPQRCRASWGVMPTGVMGAQQNIVLLLLLVLLDAGCPGSRAQQTKPPSTLHKTGFLLGRSR